MLAAACPLARRTSPAQPGENYLPHAGVLRLPAGRDALRPLGDSHDKGSYAYAVAVGPLHRRGLDLASSVCAAGRAKKRRRGADFDMATSTRGPLITLGALVVLTGILLAANTLVGGQAAPTSASSSPTGSSTSPPTPTDAASSSSTPAPIAVQAVFAGVTSGSEATLAIAVNGGQAAAYLCDGKSLEAWLQGSVTGDQIALTGRNGAGLTGSISGSAMFGTVTTSTGRTFPFSATQAGPPAGVYQARFTRNGLATRVGWAVLPDGTQVGIVAEGGPTGTKRAAPRLDLTTRVFTLDGTDSTATPVAGTDIVVGGG